MLPRKPAADYWVFIARDVTAIRKAMGKSMGAAGRRAKRRTEWLLINPHIVVWGLAFLHWLPAILSIDTISRIGAKIGLTAGPRTRRHGRAVANIKRALPELSPIEHERIARPGRRGD